MNIPFLICFLYETVSTLPYRLMGYYPFRKRLLYPMWTIALLIGCTQLLHSALYAWLTVQDIGGERFLEFFFAAICFLIYTNSVDADRWKTLFLYVFLFDYIILVRGISLFAEARLFYSPELEFNSLRSLLLNLIVLAMTAPFMLLFLKRTAERVFHTDAPSLWKVIWLLPVFTTLIVLLYTGDLSPENVRQIRFLLSRVLLIFGMFSLYGVLFQTLDIIRNEAALEEQAAQQENLLALQRTQYSQLSRHMQETRQARHDLAQHLRIINNYISTGSDAALKEYVENYQQSLPPDTSRSWCKNFAVNTIVSYYFQEAENSGIDFTAQMSLPEQLPISEPEFTSVLGNLLENALLACRSVENTAPFIRVLAKADEQKLLLTVDNTAVTAPTIKAGRFLSSRHEGYGLGTESVRTIAERHQGRADFRWEDGIFYASVSLRAMP
ncbi:MAG: GHKL domain-containing protein [Lachnospiraceae bacterium]|nr:GHKL domain-containing protein [Lachnospiraceae bacterium]